MIVKTNKIIYKKESDLINNFFNIKYADISKGNLILVNKEYKLKKNYKPNLIKIEDNYTKNTSNNYMEIETYHHFKKMVDKAKLDNVILYNVSSYRSFKTQKNIYKNYIKIDGKEKANRYSAKPGHSEHQTGLACDIITTLSKDHFENTKEYRWLQENSYKYGFILRYPKNKEYITGYIFEPWHYRYIGINVATYIHKNNITFEEYYHKFIKDDNK